MGRQGGLGRLPVRVQVQGWIRTQPDEDLTPESPAQPPQETGPEKLSAYRHILVAQDFSSHSSMALSRAVELAGLYGARVSLIHAVESAPYVGDSLDMGTILPPAFMEADQIVFDHAVAKLAENGESLDLADVQTAVLWGTPKSTILSYAEAQNADLIVVGSHGRHGLARRLGSTASALAHSAGCDVMVVKASADD